MMSSYARKSYSEPSFSSPVRLAGLAVKQLSRIPDSRIALIGRFSIAAIFWKSCQTKIQGLVVDLINGEFTLGVPRLFDSALYLFREEYRIPFFTP